MGLVGLLGCATSSKSNQYVRRDDAAPLVDEKYSLQADRARMNEMRRDVPEDIRRENDELAYVLQMFQEVRRSPQDIRAQFDSTVRKRRDLISRDLQKEREEFTKKERKGREAFLKQQKDAREAFTKTKPEKDARDDFYKDQDEKRRDFFADERDRRQDFESDMRERRKNFDDYIRQKQQEFNQEYRVYSRKYEEMRKQKQDSGREGRGASPPAATMSAEAEEISRELEALRHKPGTSLQSGE